MSAGAAASARADPARVAEAVARQSDGAPVAVHETHISWVFVSGDRAFKLKKPVVLDFLDYGTAARRRAMCQEEVRLNARLAPDLYLGVRSIANHGGRLEIVDDGDPAAVDYVVEMRRYDDAATLAALADVSAVTGEQMSQVGRRLAEFHAGCPARPEAGGATAVRHELHQNLSELADARADRVMMSRTAALGRFLDAWIAAHLTLLDSRALGGHVREAHGDLRAEHVIVAPRLSVVDCVEFDPALRTLDVSDDLAFLVMDLCARGAEPAAAELVAAYRRSGGDCGSDELLWFFAVHRALIRAKVALMRSRQTGGAQGDEGLLAVAERCAWRARGPMALLICGVPASGKSHLATQLAAITGCRVISSDIVRKGLAGLAAHERAPDALYTPAADARTYRELGRRAAADVRKGRGVLVDATFRRRADRDAFAAGWGDAGALLFVECVAPVAELRRRAAGRDAHPGHASDATAEVVERERGSFEPLDEADPDRHLVLRTDRAADEVVADLLALLDVRLARNG